jgi:type IV pilus assembly protein PilM
VDVKEKAMAANKGVWGIDLGQCALKAIRLRPAEEKDKVEVADHVYIEHSRILSHPAADRPALVADAMKKFIDQHDLSKETLVVSVPGQHTLARFTKLPPVENRRKIPELVRYEAQQQIPFDMDEVIWDYQVFEDAKGGETEVGIFAMRRDLLREQLQYLANLNLEPAVVQSAPLALYNALRFDGICGDEPVCILDIGAQNTDLIVVVEGKSLWTRNIPLGGNNFTEILLKTFKLSFGKAERLKRDAQKHKYARQIFQAMRPVFADLVAEIQRSIGFFTSSRRGVRLNKIIAMGNAFKLPGMVKFIQQNLGMDVIRPTTFNKLMTASDPNAAMLQEQLLSYGVAYGLALQGLGLAQITSNLLPTEIAQQVVWRKKTPWFYGTAACLVLAAGVVWGRNLADARAVTAGRGDDPVLIFTKHYLDDDKEHKDPYPDQRAVDVVEKGPTAQSPVGKAKEVIAASQHLGDVLADIQNKNKPAIDQAKEIADLEAKERVWPEILQMIHNALPKPDPQLAEALAQGPTAYVTMIKANPDKYERGKRREIYIERLRAEFSPDVLTAFRDREGRTAGHGPGMAGQPPTDMLGAGEGSTSVLPGFLIDFWIRSPNQRQFAFINETFLASLRESARPGAYIDKVTAPLRGQLKKGGAGGESGGSAFVQASGSSFGAGASVSNAGGVQSNGIKVAENYIVDPLTNEPMQDDWEYRGTIVVVLGDKKPRTPAAAMVPTGGNPDAPPGN